MAGIIIALAIVVTNLQYAIDNYGINNWGLGLEAIASGSETEWKYVDHCTYGPELDYCFTVLVYLEHKLIDVVDVYGIICENGNPMVDNCQEVECDDQE